MILFRYKIIIILILFYYRITYINNNNNIIVSILKIINIKNNTINFFFGKTINYYINRLVMIDYLQIYNNFLEYLNLFQIFSFRILILQIYSKKSV